MSLFTYFTLYDNSAPHTYIRQAFLADESDINKEITAANIGHNGERFDLHKNKHLHDLAYNSRFMTVASFVTVAAAGAYHERVVLMHSFMLRFLFSPHRCLSSRSLQLENLPFSSHFGGVNMISFIIYHIRVRVTIIGFILITIVVVVSGVASRCSFKANLERCLCITFGNPATGD